MIIDVIVDADFALSIMQAMQPPDILRQSSLPRDWHRQEERVKPGIIKAFTDELSGRTNHKRFIVWCIFQGSHLAFHLSIGLTAQQNMNRNILFA